MDCSRRRGIGGVRGLGLRRRMIECVEIELIGGVGVGRM